MPKVDVGDIEIYYEIKGQGDPLLMIMGLKFSLLDWGEKLPQELAKNYKVILFDNRDAGRSSQATRFYSIADMANDASGFLDELGILKAHVFGISMGGMIAQHFALNHANKLDKLILGCTMAGGDCSVPGSMGGIAFSSNQSQQDEDENLLKLLFPDGFITNNRPDLLKFIQTTKPYHSEPAAVERQWSAIFTHDTCNLLQNITAPTLMLTGDSDVAIPSQNSNVLSQKILNSRLEVIKGAAHAFCYSHWQETAKLVTKFLQ